MTQPSPAELAAALGVLWDAARNRGEQTVAAMTLVVDVLNQHVVAALAPVPMRLVCEGCGELHIDTGKFATKPHHTHACQNPECGLVWRPAKVNTVGVRFLPGFQNLPPDFETKG